MQQDGGYTLRGGPLDALIAYAASTTSAGIYVPTSYMYMNLYTHNQPGRELQCTATNMTNIENMCTQCISSYFLIFVVKQFTEAFLLTYYTFITPEELISKLMTRYVNLHSLWVNSWASL